MSRARKLCEDINKCIRKAGRAYIISTNNTLKISSDFTNYDKVIMCLFYEISEIDLLDHILMLWEDECDSGARHLLPSYLWAIRERLWSDYNVD